MSNRTRLWIWACVLCMPIGAVLYRVESGALESCDLAVAAEADGRAEEAAYQFQVCAKWNTVLSARSLNARNRLRELAITAKASGNLEHALTLNRYRRAVLLSTNHVFRSDAPALDEINEEIAALTAEIQWQRGGTELRGRTKEELRSHHLKLLERPMAPTPVEGLLVFGCFACFLVSVVFTIWRGMDGTGAIVRRIFTKGVFASIVSFVAFCLALARI